MKVDRICEDFLEFAEKIFSELGGGFPEHVVKNALAIEPREARIPYLKEVNIEIFYHAQCVGTDRPDFVLLPIKRRGQSYRAKALKIHHWICAHCGREFSGKR